MPTTGNTTTIAGDELIKMNGNCQLVDVRTPLEFESQHIKGSYNIPLDELADRSSKLDKDKTIVFICRTGMRAKRAQDMVSKYNYDSLVLEGGVTNWVKSGNSIIEGKKRLSLERQVQLTIGLILLSSTALGCLVSPWFYIMPAFIGCGLTFAGLTGYCGLAMLIAKAPWNKLEDKSETNTKSCCS